MGIKVNMRRKPRAAGKKNYQSVLGTAHAQGKPGLHTCERRHVSCKWPKMSQKSFWSFSNSDTLRFLSLLQSLVPGQESLIGYPPDPHLSAPLMVQAPQSLNWLHLGNMEHVIIICYWQEPASVWREGLRKGCLRAEQQKEELKAIRADKVQAESLYSAWNCFFWSSADSTKKQQQQKKPSLYIPIKSSTPGCLLIISVISSFWP